jgi:hypothetical protein
MHPLARRHTRRLLPLVGASLLLLATASQAAGLTTRRSGHDDHVHVRYCEAWHPVIAYRCP